MLNRAVLIDQIRERASQGFVWDVVVVGAGATGLGVALDATSRGLNVLCLDAKDFAHGTSSRSSKLIHGGLRYLRQGHFGLVRIALAERDRLLANAPNLVKPLELHIPVRNVLQRWWYGLGLKLYSYLANGHVQDDSNNQNKAPVHLTFWDAQFDDARLAIALMKTIFKLGGFALNYCPVVGMDSPAKNANLRASTWRLSLQPKTFDGEELPAIQIVTRAVVNAAGPWADAIRQLVANDAPVKPLLTFSQGVHVVLPAHFYPHAHGVLVPKTSDGRIVFILPWKGQVLLGTTDTHVPDVQDEPVPQLHEIEFLLKTAQPYLSQTPSLHDIQSAFAGLRPLLRKGGGFLGWLGRFVWLPTRLMPRDHTVLMEANGLVTIAGGKWTTYRHMAEDVMNTVCKRYGWANKPSRTAVMRLEDDLPGYTYTPRPGWRRWQAEAPKLNPLELTDAELEQAILEEMAMTIEDVLARRSRLLLIHPSAASGFVSKVRERLKTELKHSDGVLNDQEAELNVVLAQYALKGFKKDAATFNVAACDEKSNT